MKRLLKKAKPAITKRKPVPDKAISRKQPEPPPIQVPASARTHARFGKMLDHTILRSIDVMRKRGAPGVSGSEGAFAGAAIGGLEPQNPAEIMHVQLMLAAYDLGMQMAVMTKQAEMLDTIQTCGQLSIKMIETFDQLHNSLMKLRRPQQTVRVEHVSIHGGQTVVGNVVHPAPGGPARIESQAHATSETIDARAVAVGQGASVFSENSPRDAVPIASNTKGPLPNARRRTRKRSAQG